MHFFVSNFLLLTISPNPKSMSIFEFYEQQFVEECEEIQNNLLQYRDNVLKRENIEMKFSSATELLKQMEIEMCSQQFPIRKVLNDKVTSYKATLSSLRVDYAKANAEFQKENILGRSSVPLISEHFNDNTIHSRLNSGEEMLVNAAHTIDEAIAIGDHIIEELASNHEKLGNVRSKVTELSSLIDRSKNILKIMTRRFT